MIHSGKTLLCDKICKFETNQIYLYSGFFQHTLLQSSLTENQKVNVDIILISPCLIVIFFRFVPGDNIVYILR